MVRTNHAAYLAYCDYGFFNLWVADTNLSLQKEEEKLRAAIRRENQQRRVREKHSKRGLTASYLEPDRLAGPLSWCMSQPFSLPHTQAK